MKAILEFDLDDPDDALAHRRCISATNAYIAIHDVAERLRRLDNDGAIMEPSKMREEFYEILENYSVDLNDII